MNKKRTERKLTLKMGKAIVVISAIVSEIILIILYKGMGMFTREILQNEDKMLVLGVMLVLIPIGTGSFVAYRIIELDKIKMYEQLEQAKTYLKKYLNSECFTEIFIKYSENINDREEMFKEILQKGKYKFYAMFTPDDNISFSVRDKNDVEVYSIVCNNPVYIYYNFTFKEEEKDNV